MSFIRKDCQGRLSVRHKAKEADKPILRYAVENFGFLLPRNKTMSLAAFSFLIKKYYAGGTRLEECLRVLRNS